MKAKMNVAEDNKFASVGAFAKSNTRCKRGRKWHLTLGKRNGKAQVCPQMCLLSMASTSQQKCHYNYQRKFKGNT